jgi:hypothetical protein
MEKKFQKAIEEYQCSGCVSGSDIECFKNHDGGIGCGKHHAGTIAPGIGNFFLGMPKGFDRLGENTKMKPYMFENWESFDWGYDKFNIPVWKFKNENGHTLVRGMMPRRNESFIHIILEDCIDKIECRELTQEDIDEMD